MTTDSCDAGAEAAALAGAQARVLEPSPPAVRADPWQADDPATPAFDWDGWLTGHPEHLAWVERRWLSGNPQLGPLPAGLATTRLSWHLLGAYVLSPARRGANGKIGLRWVLDGIGTPFFGADTQLRVVGDLLVRQEPTGATATRISTLADAASFAGLDGPDLAWAADSDVPPAGDTAAPLPVDPVAAAWLGRWFGLGNAALEGIRAAHPAGRETRVQLWPEHFDLAVTLPVAGADVTFGASPGDAGHPEPYLYVLPGRPVDPVDGWNAQGWSGALLGAGAIATEPSARLAAAAFFADRVAALTHAVHDRL